jgi:uncharacterized membrane protein
MTNSKASSAAMVGIFIAIMIVVQILTQIVYAFWPSPIQPTLMQIPVIIGSIFLGPKKGAFLGFIMGLYSFLYSTLFPIPTSFLFTPFQQGGNFWSLVIAFGPRILIGVFPYFIYKAVQNRFGAGLAGFVGNATNGILVLTAIFVFFGSALKETFGALIVAILSTNTLVETLASIILTAAIVPALMKTRRK